MESVFETKIASRGWHFYGKTTWKTPKKGQKLYAENEKDKIALMHDPYAVAWKINSKQKIIAETVGHIPKELSRAACFFLKRGGKITGVVCEEKYRPSPIPKGGLEIMLDVELKIEDAKRRILERFQNIIESNYENNITGERPIYDQAVLNLQAENFGATPESLEIDDDEEEDHLIDDEDDNRVICID